MKKINNILKKLTNPLLILSLISIVIIFTADTFIMDTAKQVKAVAISASILALHMLIILVLDLLIAKERPNAKRAKLEPWQDPRLLSIKIAELEEKNANLKSTISYLVRKDEASEETIELLKTAVKIAEQELHDVKHDIKLSVNTSVSERINSEGDYDVEPTWKGDLELILLTLENEIGLNTGTNYLVRSLEEQIADIDFANTNEIELIAITKRVFALKHDIEIVDLLEKRIGRHITDELEISNGEEIKNSLYAFQFQLCEIDAGELTEQLTDLAIEFNQQKNPNFKTLIDSFGYSKS